MLNFTGRTLSGFMHFMSSCVEAVHRDVNYHKQDQVDKHISDIDKLAKEVPDWSNWFPSRDDMSATLDRLRWSRKNTLERAREARKEDKRHQVA